MTRYYAGGRLAPVFLKIHPEHIVRLKYVLESYEHLGVLRTLRKEDGIVAIFAIADTIEELEEVLRRLERELDPPPLRLGVPDLRTLGVIRPEDGPHDDPPDWDSDSCLWLVDS